MKMLLEPVQNLFLLQLMHPLLMMPPFYLLDFASFLLILQRLALVILKALYIFLEFGIYLFTTFFWLLQFKFLQEASNPNRTLDLASALDVGPTGNRSSNDYSGNSGSMRSVMTIAFEFAFESHMQDHVASMARQYVRSIISSVQRVALALSPSHLSSQAGLRTPLGTPEAQTLARWICNSYRWVYCFLLMLSPSIFCN